VSRTRCISLTLATIALPAMLGACRITPDEIQRIETQNQLLREEIRVVKQKCEYYKELELEVEGEGESD
jgi:hypothetical protein